MKVGPSLFSPQFCPSPPQICVLNGRDQPWRQETRLHYAVVRKGDGCLCKTRLSKAFGFFQIWCRCGALIRRIWWLQMGRLLHLRWVSTCMTASTRPNKDICRLEVSSREEKSFGLSLPQTLQLYQNWSGLLTMSRPGVTAHRPHILQVPCVARQQARWDSGSFVIRDLFPRYAYVLC